MSWLAYIVPLWLVAIILVIVFTNAARKGDE